MIAVDDDLIRRMFVDAPPSDRPAHEILAGLLAARYPLLAGDALELAVTRLASAVSGLGVLDDLLRDETVTDILINGPGPVWVERRGCVQRTDLVLSETEIAHLLERVFADRGLSLDRAHPVGDTRLPNGARVSAVLEPLVIGGTHVAVRRFATHTLPLDAFGPSAVVELLQRLVVDRANAVVFGPTGSGKTSLVNALASLIPPTERIITIEDAAELRLPLPHVVRMEGRPDNGDGAGGVTTRSLVRAALRLRPDRLIVGEVRGPEALDMIWAMSTGHNGSLSTCHAKSASDALARLETFVMLADATMPLSAVRAQVRSAVDVAVGVARNGARRGVVSIDRVVRDPDHPTGIEPLVVVGAS